MEYIDHKLTLDVHETVAPVSLSLKRRETGHRLLVRLADKGYPYHISDDCYAVFTAKKADGEVIFNNCTIEDCVIAYEMTDQTVAATGLLCCEIQLYGADSKLLVSPSFYIVVVDTLYDEQATLQSTTEYLALTDLISGAATVIKTGNEAIDQWHHVIGEAQEATQDAVAATDAANQAAENANSCIEELNTAIEDAVNVTQTAATAVQNAETATQQANDSAAAANAAYEQAKEALAATNSIVQKSEQAVKNAEQAVKDVESSIESATIAKEEAMEAAERANASSVLAEQANEKVDKLREVVSKFHSNIVENASGETIILDDASDMELAGLNLYGRTEQVTTTGKNLLPNNAITQTINGVTFAVNADSSVTVNGTNNTGSTITCTLVNYSKIPDHLVGKSMIVSGGVDANVFVEVGFARSDGSSYYARSTTIENQFAVDANVTHWYVVIRVETGTTVANKTVYPMLRLASVTNATYEPYTGGIPSPSPAYPQALNSMGDDGSVDVYVGYEPTVTSVLTGANVLSDGVVDNSSTATNFDLLIYELSDADTVNVKPDAGQYVIGFFANIPTVGSVTVDGSRVVTTPKESKTVSVPQGAEYVCVRTASGLRTTPISVNKTLTISTPTGLPGIPVTSGGNYTDSNGQQWICDEVDFEKGVYVQSVMCERMTRNSGQWSQSASLNTRFILTKNQKTGIAPICTHFMGLKSTPYESGYVGNNVGVQLCFVAQFTTLEDWLVWLDANEVYVAYALAEPIETALSAEQLSAFSALHTNYPNTTITTDEGAGLAVKYVADTKLYIDKKFAELSSALINN